jgi:hypothetical protein
MGYPANDIKNRMELAILQVLQASMTGLPATTWAQADDATVEIFPRVIASLQHAEEAIYQTGNYQMTIQITCKEALYTGTPAADMATYAKVLDVLQNKGLVTLLNNTGYMTIQGIVLGEQALEEVGERQWIKRVDCDFFGFANTSGSGGSGVVTTQVGSQIITAGVSVVPVTFPDVFFAQPTVLVTVATQAGEDLITANVRANSIGLTGFIADLGVAAPSGNYLLQWEAVSID